MPELHKVTVLLELELSGEVKDLLDKVGGRVYTMDNIESVTAFYLEKRNELENRNL